MTLQHMINRDLIFILFFAESYTKPLIGCYTDAADAILFKVG